MDDLMIAVDGGGTKTEFVLFSSDGKILDYALLEGTNPNVYGLDNAFLTLKKGIDLFLCNNKTKIIGIYCGIAGCGLSENASYLTHKLKKEYNTQISVVSDIENVCGSISGVDDCINVICGTGMAVYAKKNGEYHRFGGWGYLLEEGGSGFSIGRDALRAVLREKDGIGNKTLLTHLVSEKIGGDIGEKISEIYKGGSNYIASFSQEVFEAYKKGDTEAEKILEKNFSCMAEFINSAYKKYCCDATVVISGGITSNKEIFKKFLKNKIDSEIKLVFPEMKQIYGACRNACRVFDKFCEGFDDNFKKYYCKFTEEDKNAENRNEK